MIDPQSLTPPLAVRGGTKIVLVVMDGLGGFRTAERPSELAAARTPNLDQLAREGSSGLHTLVSPGITPGSGVAHMALFGYDPTQYNLGRGALSAAGVGFDLKPGDVAARVNFCTLGNDGTVADRRAGRIPSSENERLCSLIRDELEPPEEVEAFFATERDHRALLVIRGEGLSPLISDTDPQQAGLAPLKPAPLGAGAVRTCLVLQEILDQVEAILQGEQANFILLRGFDTLREFPSFPERHALRAVGVAGYPMYAGVARILGMDTLALQPSFSAVAGAARQSWDAYDFFFLHEKGTDSAGEDGDFDRKVAVIESVDALIPSIVDLGPGVICVTGDHATPSQLKAHSWHPVPFVMRGPAVGVDSVARFDEEAAREGAFGQVHATNLAPLMLAGAGRLAKYGP